MAKQITAVRNAVAAMPAKPWPKQTEIDAVARQLDHMVSYCARLDLILNGDPRYQRLEDMQTLLDELAVTGINFAAIEERLNSLEPAEWRDEDYNIQTSAVSKMLAVLVGSFPTSNLPDAAVFTRVMLDDILALDPDFLTLEGTCRRLRQSQKFMPAICEIIEAFKVERRSWTRRYEALDVVEDKRTALAAKLANSTASLEKTGTVNTRAIP